MPQSSKQVRTFSQALGRRLTASSRWMGLSALEAAMQEAIPSPCRNESENHRKPFSPIVRIHGTWPARAHHPTGSFARRECKIPAPSRMSQQDHTKSGSGDSGVVSSTLWPHPAAPYTTTRSGWRAPSSPHCRIAAQSAAMAGPGRNLRSREREVEGAGTATPEAWGSRRLCTRRSRPCSDRSALPPPRPSPALRRRERGGAQPRPLVL